MSWISFAHHKIEILIESTEYFWKFVSCNFRFSSCFCCCCWLFFSASPFFCEFVCQSRNSIDRIGKASDPESKHRSERSKLITFSCYLLKRTACQKSTIRFCVFWYWRVSLSHWKRTEAQMQTRFFGRLPVDIFPMRSFHRGRFFSLSRFWILSRKPNPPDGDGTEENRFDDILFSSHLFAFALFWPWKHSRFFVVCIQRPETFPFFHIISMRVAC